MSLLSKGCMTARASTRVKLSPSLRSIHVPLIRHITNFQPATKLKAFTTLPLTTTTKHYSTQPTTMVAAIASHAEFKTLISTDKIIIIDFWATWCGPCKVISPIFEKMADQFPNIGFYTVDVDAQSEISQEVGVRAMPTFAAFKNGEKIDTLVGANPVGLKALLDKLVV